jgi:BirA family biotin operon repressor/biotin-[acetyl-CoA-carboxylase] ligase
MSREPSFLDGKQLRANNFVRHVEIHDSLDSTNDRAAMLAHSAEIEMPALLVARRQTAGRGRGLNTWWSADGALTFSLLLNPASLGIAHRQWPQVSLATAVAVCDAVVPRLPRRAAVSIKWPNDVLLDGRKVCGILIESPGGGAPAKDRLIVGVGINVNNSCHAAPQEILPICTALCDVADVQVDLTSLLADVLVAIRHRFDQISRDDDELAKSWGRLNYFAGRNIAIQHDSRTVEGNCLGIDTDGALIIDTPFGRQRHYSGSARLT